MSAVQNEAVAVIIPALNEAEALRLLLPELTASGFQSIIVVDNGSVDETAEVARTLGAQVVNEAQRGYGQACWRGVQAALARGADMLVFMDGDGSDNPGDLPAMLAPLYEQRADLVMGSRVTRLAEAGAVPVQARLGNWLVSHLLNLMYRTRLHDIGSLRAMRCSALLALDMRERTFGWPVEMLVKSARARYRIVEVALHYRKRQAGRSKVAGTLVGSVRAAWAMLHTTFRYAGPRVPLAVSPLVDITNGASRSGVWPGSKRARRHTLAR
ncbi:MAG TPA: glycosyltransferase family 2 protein [Ktedonobacteraceae bacterium]|nr:glycosyltransferase family 2 protein [Ktedonobacteraceae bacterium]